MSRACIELWISYHMKDFRAKYIYFLSALIFLTGVFLIVWFGWQYFSAMRIGTNIVENFTNSDSEKTTENKDCDFRRVLDGVCVQSANEVNPRLVAVMIENHVDARPQSGLAEASIVYEAPVEANYTRFLAIYPADLKINKIGPVRSARPYYLDWLSEYGDILYMHVGGSPAALDLIKQYKLNDLNEFYRGWYYWRDDARTAPHNVYTSSELWNKALEERGTGNEERGDWIGWKFVTSSLEHKNIKTLEQVKEITVSFLSPNYEAVWKYNTSTNQYMRGEWVADDVIVQFVKAKVIDEIGRQELATIGKGEALVFKNGEVVKASWQKADRTSRTRFLDENGSELEFNPGKIWIEVANQNTKVNYE